MESLTITVNGQPVKLSIFAEDQGQTIQDTNLGNLLRRAINYRNLGINACAELAKVPYGTMINLLSNRSINHPALIKTLNTLQTDLTIRNGTYIITFQENTHTKPNPISPYATGLKPLKLVKEELKRRGYKLKTLYKQLFPELAKDPQGYPKFIATINTIKTNQSKYTEPLLNTLNAELIKNLDGTWTLVNK